MLSRGTIKDKLFCWSAKPALLSPEQQQACLLFNTRGHDLLQNFLITASTAVQATSTTVSWLLQQSLVCTKTSIFVPAKLFFFYLTEQCLFSSFLKMFIW